MKTTKSYNELLLVKLQNQDKILQLAESNFEVERDMLKLKMEESLNTSLYQFIREMGIPEHISKILLPHAQAENQKYMQQALKDIDSDFAKKINAVRLDRSKLAAEAQQIISNSNKAQGDVESEEACKCVNCQLRSMFENFETHLKGQTKEESAGLFNDEESEIEFIMKKIASEKGFMVFKV